MDYQQLGEANHEELDYLNAITSELQAASINIDVDLCMVRSHEYYTGFTFEIDIIGNEACHVEVAGGGRYDRLLPKFAPVGFPQMIPSTGFAFGMERLLTALTDEGMLNRPSFERSSIRDLSADGAIKTITISTNNPRESAASYMRMLQEYREERYDARISIVENSSGS